ncbi:OLC1v1023155C1 [Oldenlandia corymbosa var. corymbosa]|uniref:OLC1v1023155C1 n=1 Tax=Oldenlandia corymbosa var. corymbosa TaxID=529605 RepID=A0AAV1C235_OLDCO|nr:OLC1v1023155C1 [Oldenlandia corymbosa var. corymbosa]
MAVLPVFKLATLLLRTMSKPIASRLKKDAGLHPKFRDFIINAAQANHRFSTTLQRRLYGVTRFDLPIPKLNEEKAVQAAADMLGELFVFTVAGLAIIFEVQRNSRSEARKEEKRRQELEVLNQKNQALSAEVDVLRKQLDEVALLKSKLAEVEVIAKGCSHKNMFQFWQKTAEKTTVN